MGLLYEAVTDKALPQLYQFYWPECLCQLPKAGRVLKAGTECSAFFAQTFWSSGN